MTSSGLVSIDRALVARQTQVHLHTTPFVASCCCCAPQQAYLSGSIPGTSLMHSWFCFRCSTTLGFNNVLRNRRGPMHPLVSVTSRTRNSCPGFRAGLPALGHIPIPESEGSFQARRMSTRLVLHTSGGHYRSMLHASCCM